MSDTRVPPFPSDVLLEHRDWVRRLARSLVGDPEAAADLEQDTMVRALQSMPRETRSPRAWLGTVLRNRFRDTLRTRERRAARESDVARDRTQPPAGDVAAIAESHRQVLDAVLSLDAPFRDTVLLRYFEGLEPAEIAQRQGVPAATVRTRLHRGLGKLRVGLDGEHGGGDRRWRAALAPLLAAPPAGRDAPAAPRRTGRPVSVAVAVGAAAVVVGLAIWGALAWTGDARNPQVLTAVAARAPAAEGATDSSAGVGGGRAREHVQPGTDRASSGGDATTTPGADGQPAAPMATTAAAPPGLRVLVEDAGGTPVDSARVKLLDGSSFAKSRHGRTLAASVTGADGRAALSTPSAAELRFVAHHGGRAAITPVVARDDALAAEQRLVLEPASPLRGVLVTPSGEPIRGARVALMLTGDVFGPGGTAVSDTEGHFGFGPLPHSAFRTPANLAITCPGFPATDHPAALADLTGPGMRVVIAPAVTLRGRCVTPEGEPVVAVWVSCTHAVEPAETGADGRFVVDGIDAAKSERSPALKLECDTHAPRRIDLSAGDLSRGDLGDVVLAPGATIRGIVVGPDGAPVPRASVFAEAIETGVIARQGPADDEGRFVFEHCGDEPHEIVASARADDAFSGLTGVLKGVRPSSEEVVVRISAAQTVLVEIVDADTGEPLRLTNVLVYIDALDGDEDAQAGSGVSSEDGFTSVRIRAKRPGAYRLTFRSFEGWGEHVIERIDVHAHRETRVCVPLREQ